MNVNAFWKDILEQNSDALKSYFCSDAVIRWHCTNEQFTVSEFIQANCNYPGDWDGTIERLNINRDQIVTVVKVFPKDHTTSFHVVSFIELKNDKVIALDEYWADDGEVPDWRKNMKIGKPINNI